MKNIYILIILFIYFSLISSQAYDVHCKDSTITIPTSLICDNYINCPSGDDEWGCSTIMTTRAIFFTNDDVYKCRGSFNTIPKSYFCDYIEDCPSGDDEENCSTFETIITTMIPTIRKDDYYCINSLIIIPNRWICDNNKDCPHGDDEWGCYRRTTTRYGIFYCKGTSDTIHKRYVCDNNKDCPFGDDEWGCPRSSTIRNFRTTSSSLKIGIPVVVGLFVITIIIIIIVVCYKKKSKISTKNKQNNTVNSPYVISPSGPNEIVPSQAQNFNAFPALNSNPNNISNLSETNLPPKYAPPRFPPPSNPNFPPSVSPVPPFSSYPTGEQDNQAYCDLHEYGNDHLYTDFRGSFYPPQRPI